MVASPASQPDSGGPKVFRFVNEKTRRIQLKRLHQLHYFQDKECTEAAQYARMRAKLAILDLETRFREPVRIEVPSERLLARVLGLLRSLVTMKNGYYRMELSAEEIGELLHASASTVKAALRVLGCNRLRYKGVDADVAPAGILHRARRTCDGVKDGVRQRLYRTSAIALTHTGRSMLRLPMGEDYEAEKKSRRASRNRSAPRRPIPTQLRTVAPYERSGAAQQRQSSMHGDAPPSGSESLHALSPTHREFLKQALRIKDRHSSSDD